MKYSIALITLFFAMVSCGGPSANQMQLSGEVKGLKKGTLLLQKLEDSLYVSLDSVAIDGTPSFQFSEEITSPEVYFLTLTFKDSSNMYKRIPFFAEAGDIRLYTSLKNYDSDVVVNGSANQVVYNQYKDLMERFSDKNLELIEEGLNAMKEANDSLLTDIRAKQERLLKSSYLATINFAMNQNEMEVAPYIMLNEAYDVQVKYLDTVYNALSPKIKDSKYGKELESFIKSRKN